MTNTLIIVVFLITIWVLALFISALLAFFYQKKHKTFRQIFYPFRDLYFRTKILDLKEIETNFENIDNEKFYFEHKNSDCFIEKNKSKINKEIKKKYDYYKNDRVLFSKSTFKLLEKSLKEADYFGKLVVSNFRILIEGDANIFQLPIKNIEKVWISAFKVNKHYKNGFFVKTDLKTYKFTCEDTFLIKYIDEMVKENKLNGL